MEKSLLSLIKKNRSYRRFDANVQLTTDELKSFIDHARLSPSAKNQQSLKYKIVNTKQESGRVFPLLKWAGYIKDWDGPVEQERPSAHIIVLNDTSIADNCFCDDGIAMQSILLAATEKGYGGCIIASVDRVALRKEFNIPEHLKILYVIALGKPVEVVVLEDMDGNNIEYWRDEQQVHHVPKRAIDDIIIESSDFSLIDE